MATWGVVRRPLAATIALALPLLTGCALGDRPLTGQAITGRAGWGVAGGYLPLTADDFAQVTTEAMLAHPTFHLDMDLGTESMAMDARFDDDEGFDLSGTYDDGTTVSTMVLVDGEVYVRDTGDKVYYQFPDQLAEEVTGEMDSTNPREMAELMAAGIESLVYSGAHEVEYGLTHRYDLQMTEEVLAEATGLPASAMGDITYTIWLDDDDLMRRMQVWAFGTMVDVTLSAWGEPVTIEAPPADEVEPLPGTTDDT